MCVDFTDLQGLPKDSFPLPIINQLVDSMKGHEMMSFLDAFSGYNQILMHWPWEDLIYDRKENILLQGHAIQT